MSYKVQTVTLFYLTAACILESERVEHEAYKISQLQQFSWVTESREQSFFIEIKPFQKRLKHNTLDIDLHLKFSPVADKTN